MVLTALIPGPHDAFCSYYTSLDETGEPLLHVTKRKLRQFPVGFGEGTLHEMAWIPEAADAGLRFFRAVRLRGLGNVEFKRDARDGRLKLIECNLRFTQADALLRRAGVDLPALAYARLAGLPFEPPGMQRDGTRLWFPKNDARAFAAYRRTGATTTQAWIRSLVGRQTLPLWDVTDPRPSTDELRRRAGAAPGRIGAAVRRGIHRRTDATGHGP
jgi:predicted ATP-grasp superfamily ATP-dependent carboligase